MKKLIGTVAALLIVTTVAFAEISFGAWLRSIVAPIASDGDETVYAGITNSWGWGARTARLDINASSEDGKAGISMGVYNDIGGIGAGDNYVMWVKPLDVLRISFGRWDYTAVRGDLCYGSWNWLRPNNAVAWGEGITFPALGNQCGALFELTPIDGLLVIWNLPYAKMAAGGSFDGTYEAYEAFEKQHIAAKYTIEGIGNIKLGWEGLSKRNTRAAVVDGFEIDAEALLEKGTITAKQKTKDVPDGDDAKYLGNIAVAFDLTAVENLYVTIGGQFAIMTSDYKDSNADVELGRVALGASYKILDNFTVYGDFAMGIYNKSDFKIGPDMSFGLGLDYGIMDGLVLNVDFRGYIPSKWDGEKILDPDFSFLLGVDYSVSSNGSLGIGFQGFIAGEKGTKAGGCIYPATNDKFSFAVPIKMGVWF